MIILVLPNYTDKAKDQKCVLGKLVEFLSKLATLFVHTF